MQKWKVTEVHKVAGRLDKEARVYELPAVSLDRRKMGAVLREARILVSGQSIREIRVTREFWAEFVVFPNNATTGAHSFIFEAIDA